MPFVAVELEEVVEFGEELGMNISRGSNLVVVADYTLHHWKGGRAW